MRTDKKIRLKIGYKDFTLYFVNSIDGGETNGECVKDVGVIKITKGLNNIEKANTVLHEVFHGIWHVQGIGMGDETEERVVTAMTNGLVDFIRDNPRFVDRVISLIGK